MRFPGLAVLALLTLLNADAAHGAAASGEVCIQPKTRDLEPFLSTPADGHLAALRNGAFTVRIGNAAPVKVSESQVVCVKGLALDRRHLVVIESDRKPYTSFRFRFADHQASRLSLRYKPGYATWMLLPADRKRR